MAELREHGGRHFAVQFVYSVPSDAWCVELSEAVPAPSSWADIPGSPALLPGPAFLLAVVPDEDPSLEPLIHLGFSEERAVPYEVMRWFMDHVSQEVERCRASMAQTLGSEE